MLAQKVSTRGASVSARPVAIRASTGRKQVSVVARAFTAGMGVFGTKAGMMSFFTPAGLCVPATVIALEGGNIVTQVKTVDTDGYNAVQIGYKVVAERKVKKPELGHLAKSGAPPMKILREFKVSTDGSTSLPGTPGPCMLATVCYKTNRCSIRKIGSDITRLYNQSVCFHTVRCHGGEVHPDTICEGMCLPCMM